MRRLEQRGAVAFAAMGVAVVVILHVVILLIMPSVLEDDAPLTRLFDQPRLLRLLPQLVLVPAKEAGCFSNRPAAGEFVKTGL